MSTTSYAEPLSQVEETLYAVAQQILSEKHAAAQAAANEAAEEFSNLMRPIRHQHGIPDGIPAKIQTREDGVVFIHYALVTPGLALVPDDEPTAVAEHVLTEAATSN